MAGSVVNLAATDGTNLPEDVNAAHPMREVTKRVAFDKQWSGGDRADVAKLFDALSVGWHDERNFVGRNAAVADALARGAITTRTGGRCVELGPGTGLSTPLLIERWPNTVAIDLSIMMLSSTPEPVAPRVQADASQLPLADNTADVIVMVNMLLFPTELDRVLAESGWLLWANTSGPATPISLSADELAEALPGSWELTASSAGTGTWAVAHRAR